MTFCGGCGTENPDGELYCYRCGKPLHSERHETAVANTVELPHSQEPDGQPAPQHRTSEVGIDRRDAGHCRPIGNRREFDRMRYAILIVSGLCFVIGLYTLFGLGLEYRSLDTFSLFEESNTFYGLATGDWLTGLDQYFFWFLVIVVLIGIIIPTPAVLGASLMYFGLCMTTAEDVPVLHDVMMADMELTNGATVIGVGIVLLVLGMAYLLLFSGFESRYADKDKGDLLMLIWTGHR